MTIGARRLLGDERGRRQEVLGKPRLYWTEPQRRIFESPYAVTVAWGANGIGKSLTLAEVVRRGLAAELGWQDRGPKVVLLAGNSWGQIGVTLSYLWETVDKRWFKPKLRFEGGGMRGQRLQIFDILDGPGKGGQLRCGTFNAGAANLAGPRADLVVSDEPLPEKIYNELWPRLFGRRGRIVIGFTPTLGTSEDIKYLWDKVDDPALPWFGEIQVPLTLEAVTLHGGLVPYSWSTQEEIDRFEAGLSRLERDMRMGRTRTPATGELYFSAFGPHLIGPCNVPRGTRIGIGIDHGSKPGAQRAILVAVEGLGIDARAWVLDEYKGDGRTEIEADAAGVVAMLARHRMTIQDVDAWIGDRAHGGYGGVNGKKSNEMLKSALAKSTGLDINRTGWHEKLPTPLRYMWQPRKHDSSHWEGFDIIHRMTVGDSPRLTLSPACAHLRADFENWKGSSRDPHKDGLDALRYILIDMMAGRPH